tara:strand:- start:1159 stop:1530 length:372 start_codon:yes stop_codon:yes gene_type:complete
MTLDDLADRIAAILPKYTSPSYTPPIRSPSYAPPATSYPPDRSGFYKGCRDLLIGAVMIGAMIFSLQAGCEAFQAYSLNSSVRGIVKNGDGTYTFRLHNGKKRTLNKKELHNWQKWNGIKKWE